MLPPAPPTLPPWPLPPQPERWVQLLLPLRQPRIAVYPAVPAWDDCSMLQHSRAALQLRNGTPFCTDIIEGLSNGEVAFLCAQFSMTRPLGDTLRLAEVGARGAAFSLSWPSSDAGQVWLDVSINHTHVLRALRLIGARGLEQPAGACYAGVKDLTEALWGQNATPALSARSSITSDTLRYFLSNDWCSGPPDYSAEESVPYWCSLFEGVRNWIRSTDPRAYASS